MLARELAPRDESALGEVEQGAARTIAVSGEPGIGKTRLLTELSRRVALALAYRRAQAASRLDAAIERVAREGGLLRVELEVLSRDEAAVLLAEVPKDDREMVYRQAGGNPFYLEQLARAAADGATPRPRRRFQTADGSVPPAVAASLTEELEALSEGDRRLLDGAAVAGDPFEPELAAAAAGVEEEAFALAALDDARAPGRTPGGAAAPVPLPPSAAAPRRSRARAAPAPGAALAARAPRGSGTAPGSSRSPPASARSRSSWPTAR